MVSDSSKRLIADFRRAARPKQGVRRSNWARLQARLRDEDADVPRLLEAPPLGGAELPRWTVPVAGMVALAAALLLAWYTTPSSLRPDIVRVPEQAVDASLQRKDPSPTIRDHTLQRTEGIARPQPAGDSDGSTKPASTKPASTTRQVLPSNPVRRRPASKRPTARVVEPARPDADHEMNDVFAAELALVRGAKKALSSGDHGRALSLVQEHARRFPDGTLGRERRATEVRVLCELGRGTEAARAAQAFVAAHPSSSLAQTLETDPCPAAPQNE